MRDSFPWKSLFRFALWRIITKAESNKLKIFNVLDCLKIKVYTGKASALIIEAMETILEIIKARTQVEIIRNNINLKPVIFMDKPNNTPSVVATPFPPLNFKKIVQLWPHIQQIPNIILKVSSLRMPTFKYKISAMNTTGIKPLSRSRIKTLAPTFFPSTRKALVAPMFPEPNLRISIPLKTFPNI